MKFLVFILTVASARGALVPLVASVSHYHSQDALGQYSFGYSGGPSAKHETKSADGTIQGGYSYIDANNILQTVNYVSDPVHGFRVAGTNIPQSLVPAVSTVPVVSTIPQETPEVVAAKIAHFQAHADALHRSRRDVTFIPVISNQYHSQDNLGQYSYAYNDGLSSKSEARSADGATFGSYSYLDDKGMLQSVHYVADSLGFRPSGTNIPVPHAVAITPLETPEVSAAKAAHFAAHAEARARLLQA